MSLCDKLLNQQWETIIWFIESLEKETSQNSQQAQSLIEQCSSDLPKSILGQVEELIEKEKASKLQVLEELQIEAMKIVDKQHCRLEEARLNLTTPLTSEAETSEAEYYGGQGPKPPQGPDQHISSPALCLKRLQHQQIVAIPD